ncbi:MAG TPA: AbrB/MazE/SpoVT family DNA-binding domain-containing protein [Stellaceae bacterium]|nr:AbrB/MazE/SpoVT family DNA-binding domain-containing protein [Stellaceae bacterium]
MRARIAKWGNSLAVRIPKDCAEELGLAEGAPIEIKIAERQLILAPVQREYSLEELVAGITPENRHGETDWGGPVRKETW